MWVHTRACIIKEVVKEGPKEVGKWQPVALYKDDESSREKSHSQIVGAAVT